MPEPCLCGQAIAEPTCTVTAGPGISVSGSDPTLITAHAAATWVTYIPGTTNFTLGNAVNASRYRLVGKTVDIIIAIQFGTQSTYTANDWALGFPAGTAPLFDGTGILSGHERSGRGSLKDVSAGSPWFEFEPFLQNQANPIKMRFGDDAGAIASTANVRQGTPFTFTTSDQLVIALHSIEIV